MLLQVEEAAVEGGRGGDAAGRREMKHACMYIDP